MFGVAPIFQTVDEVRHYLWKRMPVNIACFLYSGIDFEELFLLLKPFQEKPVVDDSAIIADDVDVSRIGNKTCK